MTRHDVLFRAALSRFVLGAAALVLLPVLYPRSAGSWWVFVAYLLIAAIEQVLIRRDVGGQLRSFVAGLFDVAIMSFLVHRLGSVATIVSSFYFFAGVLNAMVVGLRVGVILAAINAVAYSTIVWCEHLGVLAFAPDVPEIARFGAPTTGQALVSSFMVTVFLLTSTTIVGLLVSQLRGRERELVRANDQLAELSQRDPLSNLYNRRYLFSQVERELERVGRGHPAALVMLDLDRFKQINDLEGHLRGDVLLKEISAAIATTTRVTDVAARYGGDEFVVLLPDTDEAQACVVAQRIADAVRDAGARFNPDARVTASVGITPARAGDSVASLLRRADENAYRAKKNGGDRVVA